MIVMTTAIEERAAGLRQTLASLEDELCVLMAQLDPDSLGSAFGLVHIVQNLQPALKTRVFSAGAVGHPQNRALINKYNLRKKVLPIEEFQDPAPHVALVDSSLATDSRLPQEVDPVIVIDHHRGTDLTEQPDRFFWIEDVGSTCTLIVELLREYQLDLHEPHSWLAVLLALGIYTDTKAMISASSRDHQAYAHVIPYTNIREVQQLIDYPLPATHFENLAHALNNCEQRENRLVAGVGRIQAEEGDDLSTIADYFLRKDGVSLAVVWGIVGDSVRVSARNLSLSTPLDEFLANRFGAASGAKLTPDGKGEGGALVRLDLGPWMSEGTGPEVEAMVGKRIKEWIFSD